MRGTLGSLLKSHNSFRINQDELGRANVLRVPIQIIGANTLNIRYNAFELTPEIYTGLSTGYTGSKMENDSDIFIFSNILKYVEYRDDENRDSAHKKNFRDELHEKIAINEPELESEFDDLQCEGLKIFIPSNVVD